MYTSLYHNQTQAFMLFRKPLIAIDVGTSSLKVLEVSASFPKKVLGFSFELLPVGAVVDGIIKDKSMVATALQRAFERAKIRISKRKAAIAIGGSTVMIKRVTIPNDGQLAIEEQIQEQFEQSFQVDLEDLYYDSAVIGQSADNATEVVLIGARQEIVEDYMEIVRTVGLGPGIIESSAFSIANMFEYNYGVTAKRVMLLNIGASSCQISILDQGKFAFNRDIPIGGMLYTQRLMEVLNLDLKSAETTKIGASLAPMNTPAEIKNVINEVNETLASELLATVKYFLENMGQREQISHVFITGGASKTLNLDTTLSRGLNLPVHPINPFQKMYINPRKFKMDRVSAMHSLFGVAVGLSLRTMGDTGK